MLAVTITHATAPPSLFLCVYLDALPRILSLATLPHAMHTAVQHILRHRFLFLGRLRLQLDEVERDLRDSRRFGDALAILQAQEFQKKDIKRVFNAYSDNIYYLVRSRRAIDRVAVGVGSFRVPLECSSNPGREVL